MHFSFKFIYFPKEVTVSSQNVSSILNGKSEHRIVGGYPISIKKAPWTVQIIYGDIPSCGGSIVSTTKILSAAHCVKGRDTKKFSIRAGTSKYNVGGQVPKISKIISHANYNSATLGNDISILFLQKPLSLSSKVAIITVDDKYDVLPAGAVVFATGWGKVCEFCDVSRTLQAVNLPVILNDRCSELLSIYQHEFKIVPSMLCCGAESGGKDTCQGT